MTNAEAVAEVERIAAMKGDDESAHCAEDDFRHRVLSTIAERDCADPAALAQIALSTTSIEFARWCA